MTATFQQYFMPIYNTCIGLLIGYLIGKIKRLCQDKKDIQKSEENTNEALKEGMAILLRHELFEYYKMYEKVDSIPKSEWEDIEKTHDVYNRLGGNHTGDRVYTEMLKKRLEG